MTLFRAYPRLPGTALLAGVLLVTAPCAALAQSEACSPEPTVMKVTPGSFVTCDIGLVGDNDIFTFQGRSGERIELVAAWTAGSGTPYITLRDPTGVSVEEGFGTSGVTASLTKSGTYSVVVNEFGNNDTVGYNLSVERAGPPSSSARPLGFGETNNSDISLPGDVDEFFFHATAGDSITLFAAWTSGAGTPYVRLYGPTGSQLGAAFGSSGINVSLAATGVHTILVSEFGYNQSASYGVTLQCTAGTCQPFARRLLVGLGPASNGWLEDIVGVSPHGHRSWIQVGWQSYASSGGETRPAFCDVDGDGRDEVVLGLGPYPGQGGWLEIKDDASTGYAHLAWIHVDWPAYNAANGETFPACGDVDNDFKDEIIVGLGTGAGGWVKAFDDATTGFADLPGTPYGAGWMRSSWAAYNSSTGAVHPAVGNLDYDSSDEIVFGLGTGSGGWVEIIDDAQAAFAMRRWVQAGNPATIGPEAGSDSYTVDVTWPAIGDLKGDGRGNLVLGLGDGAGGWLRVFDDLPANLAPTLGTPVPGGWVLVSWTAYNTAVGATYPAVGDIDGDGRAELVIGLANYATSGGWIQVLEDLAGGLVHKSWARVAWPAFNGTGGSTRPAITP